MVPGHRVLAFIVTVLNFSLLNLLNMKAPNSAYHLYIMLLMTGPDTDKNDMEVYIISE